MITRNNVFFLLLFVFIIAFPFILSLNSYYLHVCIVVVISMIMAVSLRFEFLAGIFQIGHSAFFAIGAYVSSLFAIHFDTTPWIGMISAGIMSGLIAFLIGIPILRLTGLYFALASFAFLAVVNIILQNWEKVTQGARGIPNIPTLSIGGYSFFEKLPFYYTIVIILIAVILLLFRLEKSRFGMTLVSIEQNMDLSSSIGIYPLKYKMIALVMGSFIAGVSGSFYAHYTWYINPPICSMWASFYYLVYCVVGGMSSIAGPIIGAALLESLPYVLRPLRDYESIIMAIVMLVIIFVKPTGLIDLIASIKNWLTSHFPAKRLMS